MDDLEMPKFGSSASLTFLFGGLYVLGFYRRIPVRLTPVQVFTVTWLAAFCDITSLYMSLPATLSYSSL